MDRGQRTVAGLLAVVAVLLGLNLIVKGSPAAVGQAQAGVVPPTVVAGHILLVNDTPRVFQITRWWSDGAVDVSQRQLSHPQAPNQSFCETADNPNWSCGPVPVIPGFCAADVTRNGNVDVEDFLGVLGQWGPCQ